ncbi:ABC transporter ATP-binding protein [Dermabacteraceae bacterium P13077]
MADKVESELNLRVTLSQLNRFFSRGVKIRLVLISLLSIVLGLMETMGIVLVLPLVDLAVGKNSLPAVVNDLALKVGLDTPAKLGMALVCVVVGIFVLKDVGSIWFNWWRARFLAIQRVETQSRMMEGYMSLPWQEYRKRSTAEMIRTIHDAVGRLYGSVVGGLISLVSAVFSVVAILCALFVAIPIPTLVIMVYFSVGAGLYMRFVRPRTMNAGEVIMEASVQSYLRALHGLGAYKEITLRHTEGYFTKNYKKAATEGAEADMIAGFYASIPRFLLEILFMSAVGLLLFYMFIVGEQGSVVGAMALLVAAGFRLLPNISAIISAVNSVRLGASSLDIVSKESAVTTHKLLPQHDELQRMEYRKAISLRDVRFGYDGSDEEVIKGVSLNIPYGSSIAFVGGSGAGKTTLVDIILGLLKPTSGAVLVDGKDISANPRSWQENASMVAQDVYVSGWSVRENIIFDEPVETADQKHLEATVERAQLTDLVTSLPEGLDTLCGERGTRLSGGQRQRIGIARALYRNPSLLVLDEATSALDNETEKKITDTIDSLNGGVTVVVVAHRLSTVKNVDQVVYLENGKVAGVGTFRELEASNEKFAQLVALGKLD